MPLKDGEVFRERVALTTYYTLSSPFHSPYPSFLEFRVAGLAIRKLIVQAARIVYWTVPHPGQKATHVALALALALSNPALSPC